MILRLTYDVVLNEKQSVTFEQDGIDCLGLQGKNVAYDIALDRVKVILFKVTRTSVD